jgi:hypothetical protein
MTTAANQVTLGANGTAVRVGDTVASNAAQSGVKYVVTVHGNGVLGRGAISSGQAVLKADQEAALASTKAQQAVIDDAVAAHCAQITSLGRRLDGANGAIAAAMAMGGIMVVPDSNVRMNFNLATYRGEQGFASGIVGRLSKRV